MRSRPADLMLTCLHFINSKIKEKELFNVLLLIDQFGFIDILPAILIGFQQQCFTSLVYFASVTSNFNQLHEIL